MRLRYSQHSISIAAMILLASALFFMRISAPSDLMDLAQYKQAAYVVDAAWNGHWLVQSEADGQLMSKPPMFTWIAAPICLLAGGVNRLTLSLLPFLCTVVIAIIILEFGRRRFSLAVGNLAALAYLISPLTIRQITLIRTDALLSLAVTASALSAFRAWERSRGGLWFWFWSGIAGLTKGPIGLLLAAAGLPALFWERLSGHPTPSLRRIIGFSGIFLFIAMLGGWFLLACLRLGRPIVDKMLFQELIHQAVDTHHPLGLYKTPLYFLSRFAPWSIFTCIGLWRVCARPAPDTPTRRLERFLFCWLLLGIAAFSVAPHQRADYLLPLLLPASLLAARELELLRQTLRPRIFIPAMTAACILLLAGETYDYRILQLRDNNVKDSLTLANLSATLRHQAGPAFTLNFVDTPFGLEFGMHVMPGHITPARAADLLAASPPAFIATRRPEPVLSLLHAQNKPVYQLSYTPLSAGESITLLANRPTLPSK